MKIEGLEIRCPYCGAAKGYTCYNPPTNRSHMSRVHSGGSQAFDPSRGGMQERKARERGISVANRRRTGC